MPIDSSAASNPEIGNLQNNLQQKETELTPLQDRVHTRNR